MVEKEILVMNRAGIHARPATKIVETASRFKAQVYIEKDGNRINAKSIMGILTLGAAFKSKILIVSEGTDEADALFAIVDLFEKRFDE